jgi:hypothetical protein
MSFPNIPNIVPSISLTRTQATDLLLISMAFEELGLAHVINAEGEKIQSVLGTLPGLTATMPSVSVLEAIDTSVSSVLQGRIKKEMLLGFKLEDIIGLIMLSIPQVVTFTFTGALQTFTVPENVCSVTIQAIGAAGGSISSSRTGGNGASIQGDFTVTPGEILSVLVGEQGQGSDELDAAGGGGGSFVWSGNGFSALNLSSLLIAAGGGGGACDAEDGFDGEIGESGGNGGAPEGGSGGSNGNGGGAGTGIDNGGGGAGIITNGGSGGVSGDGIGGTAIDAGAAGGAGGPSAGAGGFGGGGGGGTSGGGGGGGGFSGGGGGAFDAGIPTAGGGGGSFNSGTDQVNTPGVGTDNGIVVITLIPCDG